MEDGERGHGVDGGDEGAEHEGLEERRVAAHVRHHAQEEQEVGAQTVHERGNDGAHYREQDDGG